METHLEILIKVDLKNYSAFVVSQVPKLFSL